MHELQFFSANDSRRTPPFRHHLNGTNHECQRSSKFMAHIWEEDGFAWSNSASISARFLSSS
jgi:hypothetical protein